MLTGWALPARADTVDYDYADAYVSYTRAGHLPGRVGNAHSGYLLYGPSDYEFQLIDWRCPAGVTPPTTWYGELPATGTSCVPLRQQATTGFGGRYPSFDGPVATSDSGTEGLEELYPGTAPVSTVGYDFAFHRVGPITTTVTRGDGYRTVVRTAPMRLVGRFGPIRFTDPRVHLTYHSYDRQTQYLTD